MPRETEAADVCLQFCLPCSFAPSAGSFSSKQACSLCQRSRKTPPQKCILFATDVATPLPAHTLHTFFFFLNRKQKPSMHPVRSLLGAQWEDSEMPHSMCWEEINFLIPAENKPELVAGCPVPTGLRHTPRT